jgi:hypothetical protein
VPDQPIAGGGRGGGFDTPPARPDVPTGGGRGGGFDAPPARPDVPGGRFDADPPVGRGPDAPNTPDTPGGRQTPDAPDTRQPADDGPPARPEPDAPDGRGDAPDGDGPDGDGPDGDGPDADPDDSPQGGDGDGGGGDKEAGNGAPDPADSPFDPDALPATSPQPTTPLGRLPESIVGRGPDGLIETVNGQPVKDFLHDLGVRRAEEFRAGRTREVDPYSRGDVGEVTAVAIDLRTGRIFEGTNGATNHVISGADLHDLLKARYEATQAGPPQYPVLRRDGGVTPALREWPHPAEPLNHAEVKAMNELLNRRGENLDPAVFGEFRVDNFFPFVKDGIRSAPCCANCRLLLEGTPSNAGKNTGFPPRFFPHEAE